MEGAAPSAIRSFNRYELKYAVEVERLETLASELSDRLLPDSHGVNGMYDVWSRYYDTADLRFYWEKVDGIRFRRKLRVRTYGSPSELADDTPVYVEVKQRLNRVTQKRRVRLRYDAALALCDNRTAGDGDEGDLGNVVDEILGMVTELDLRPTSVVGYVRRAFVGGDYDPGLRVTFDTTVRGRDTDLDLHSGVEGLAIVPPHLAIVEVKIDERVPFWLTDVVARQNLQLVRVSKYCQSIERFDAGLRSTTRFGETS